MTKPSRLRRGTTAAAGDKVVTVKMGFKGLGGKKGAFVETSDGKIKAVRDGETDLEPLE